MNEKKQLPAVDILRELLRFDSESGLLYWRPRHPGMFSCGEELKNISICASWNKRFSGKQAFTADDGSGYRQGRIFGRAYRAHRVAWAIVYGIWPRDEIDHIHGDKSDNRLENIREANSAENKRNIGAKSNNTSGFKGVDWCGSAGKWRARITAGGPENHLGLFDNAEDAHAAYRAAAELLHGDFARVE